jgi:hypothetical protein
MNQKNRRASGLQGGPLNFEPFACGRGFSRAATPQRKRGKRGIRRQQFSCCLFRRRYGCSCSWCLFLLFLLLLGLGSDWELRSVPNRPRCILRLNAILSEQNAWGPKTKNGTARHRSIRRRRASVPLPDVSPVRTDVRTDAATKGERDFVYPHS